MHGTISIGYNAALAVMCAIVGAVVALSLAYPAHHGPATVTPTTGAIPPPGWTEVCTSAAIGPVCRTYPPGDDRWQPKAPVPPQRPLPTPWPGGEDAR